MYSFILGTFHHTERERDKNPSWASDKNNNGNQMRKAPPGKNMSLKFLTSHKPSLTSDNAASQEPGGIFVVDYFGMIWQQMN